MVGSATSIDELNAVGWKFDNTYARLPEVFFAPASPAKAREPRISILNNRLAEELGLDLAALSPEATSALFAGQELPAGAKPIAQAYAGHQYGHFTMLGDGRAILLGEHRTPDGRLVDIQFKGTGLTAFSRRGDGRAALGPMLREYIISEAMAALGVPTTRSLAVVTTGEPVYRESILRGAILTRVAASHLRVGTFEYAAALRNEESLRTLADYAIARHDPDLIGAPNRYLAFFRTVVDRQASLIARWQFAGFIHGVMNTDNMAISGETIDYGPCAFMNAYRPETVYSSIDRHGRYAYGNQPAIAQWNLARLAEALLPLFDADAEAAVSMAREVLNEFPALFERHWLNGMRAKLGLQIAAEGDRSLIDSLLDWMAKSGADFTNTFASLASVDPPAGDRYQETEFVTWHARWRERLRREDHSKTDSFAVMRAANPVVIPRNHRVEEALSGAEEREDLTVLHDLLAAIISPYDDSVDRAKYQDPPADECGYRTFCGT
jgi:serine/tyrosine/threonine adenylyltransferase